MARKFLILIATIIFLLLGAGVVWTLYGEQLTRFAMVPTQPFAAPAPVAANAYADKKMWIVRPDMPGNPATWMPAGFKDTTPKGNAAIFYIHPTSFLDRSEWNAPLTDEAANDRANRYVRGQASVFSLSGDIWAPRYRQATIGAFLTTQPEAQRALDAAYTDVVAAWEEFLRQAGPDRPIIVAGHSQGAVHLLRLIRERISGQPVAKRIAALYPVGWPVSATADLPALGFPACQTPEQSGCVQSWLSYAEPADPGQFLGLFDGSTGFNGQPRRDAPLLCSNPLTGTPGGKAPATANNGTVIPNWDFTDGTLVTNKVPARCEGRGLLLIGPPPEKIGRFVLPGNNYHVFDYSLFWANIRADAARRVDNFAKQQR